MATSTTDRDRQNFEQWAASMNMLLRRTVSGGRYESFETEWAYKGFTHALRIAAERRRQEEPVAIVRATYIEFPTPRILPLDAALILRDPGEPQ